MILTYVWHDCFWLQSETANVVFDYWKDSLADNENIPRFVREADKGKPMYVVVSHHHKDHFTKRIFEWQDRFDDIHYIISNDVARNIRHILNPDSLYRGHRPKSGKVSILQPGDRYKDTHITIDAFASTDIGNSYALLLDGKSYFHAGDLNAWIWKDESTEKEVEDAISDFKKILTAISQKYPKIDFAMFPVDSRIGSDYFTGAYLFVREIEVGHFFPMHFGLGETIAEQHKFQLDAARLSLYQNPAHGEYICLQSPYSEFACG